MARSLEDIRAKEPTSRRRYFHKLHAPDTVLSDLGEATKAQLEQVMEGPVLAKAELVGTYRKGR